MKLTIKELTMLDMSIAYKIEQYEHLAESKSASDEDDYVNEALQILKKLRGRIHRLHFQVEKPK
jgi:hypothetical protein